MTPEDAHHELTNPPFSYSISLSLYRKWERENRDPITDPEQIRAVADFTSVSMLELLVGEQWLTKADLGIGLHAEALMADINRSIHAYSALSSPVEHSIAPLVAELVAAGRYDIAVRPVHRRLRSDGPETIHIADDLTVSPIHGRVTSEEDFERALLADYAEPIARCAAVPEDRQAERLRTTDLQAVAARFRVPSIHRVDPSAATRRSSTPPPSSSLVPTGAAMTTWPGC